MQELLDLLSAAASDWADTIAVRLDTTGPLEWALFFAPFLFLEVPQYYVPLVANVLVRFWQVVEGKDRATVELGRRERVWPSVTVVVAGRNEGGSIEACIKSLVDQRYPSLEIIVVDDHSTDATEEICRRYEKRGVIRFIRNNSLNGRTGRPTATNLGIRMARGEFIVSLDADTTFDQGLIEALIEPFEDPEIGVVAGNVLVRNREKNLLTRLQAIEYATSIDLHKRWAKMTGSTLQASGAIGAFRRQAVVEIGGWDPELAEDGDICLRLVKAGWRTTFAPDAVALTDVPEKWGVIIRQRTRWDRGGYRAYVSKHGRLLRPSASTWGYAYGMWGEFVFATLLPIVYPIYALWLLSQGFAVWSFVQLSSLALYTLLAPFPLIAIAIVSERTRDVHRLIGPALVMPFYRVLMRWVKIRALAMELMRVRIRDSFLPDTAWNNAPRY
ncbi:MAG: glycosyltransferase [Planctomycetota bacterium]